MITAANENEIPGPTAQQKKLLRLVYIMGLVFALLFLGLVGGLIWKAAKPKLIVATAEMMQDIGLNPADVRHLSLDGDRLAVSTAREIIVVDVKSGKVLLRVSATP